MKRFAAVATILILGCFIIGSPSAASNDGLVAYYPFNGNANDESGNGNHGTVFNASLTPDRFGNADSAYSFQGNAYIRIPNSPSLSFFDNFTFSLWFSRSVAREQVLLAKSGDRTGLGIKGHSTGTWGIENGRCCYALQAIYAGTVNDNEWHMITVTSGNGMIRAYLDGSLKSEETRSAFDLNPTMVTQDIYLGMGPIGWYYFRGAIDDVRIYDHALSEAEIRELYIGEPCVLPNFGDSNGNPIRQDIGDGFDDPYGGTDYILSNGQTVFLPFIWYGSERDTIANWGCYLTSAVMAVNYYAQQQDSTFRTDPGQLNEWLQHNSGYYTGPPLPDPDNPTHVRSSLVIPEKVVEYANVNGVQMAVVWKDRPSDKQGETVSQFMARTIETLNTTLCNLNPVILGVTRTSGQHFVDASGKQQVTETDTWRIHDPLEDSPTTLLDQYNNTYNRVTGFSAGVQGTALSFAVHSPVEILVTDPAGRRTGFDPRIAFAFTEIPNSTYGVELLAAADGGGGLLELTALDIITPNLGEYTLEVIGSGSGSYAVEILVVDSDGKGHLLQAGGGASPGSVDTYVFTYSGDEIAQNRFPEANAGGPYAVYEGDSVVAMASGSDPDGDPITFAWDLDNDGTFETPGQSVTFSAADLDGPGSHAIAIQVTDSGGLSAMDETTVEVLNVAPAIDNITGPSEPVRIDTQPVNVTVEFTDPGSADTHDVMWDWGDQISDAQTDATSPATQDHTYAEAGVYPVTVTVTDDDGGIATQTYEFIVIYNPDAGFVTGGGWIWSPEGACPRCPSSPEGKANFGFVSKYKNGASEPTGQTEFQFKAGDLNFHSDSYEWLVIAGANAKYKGVGTINGEGAYKFMLTATDGDLLGGGKVDEFRIKIWDDNGLYYDNKMGEPDDSYAGTEIGGNIKIHKK